MVTGQFIQLDDQLIEDPSEDHRPRVALLIGDGFSRDLVCHVGLQEQIVTWPLLPPPATVKYLPSSSDKFAEGPLWDRAKFPRLVRLVERFMLREPGRAETLAKLFSLLARHRLVAGKHGDKTLSLALPHPGLELRAYLWHLFKYYDQMLWNGRSLEGLHRWRWLSQLSYLARETRLTVISYNYDLNIEKCISGLGICLAAPPCYCVRAWADRRVGRHVVTLKPHGSLTHSATGNLIRCPNMWLHGSLTLRDVHIGNQKVELAPDLVDCPPVPDLVPPGHGGEHLAYVPTDVHRAVRLALQDCDLLIVCGLSASEPDTPEVDSYLSVLKRRRPVIHIGVKTPAHDDQQNPMGRLLRAHASHYSFLRVEEIPFLRQHVEDTAKPRQRAKTKAGIYRQMFGNDFYELAKENGVDPAVIGARRERS